MAEHLNAEESKSRHVDRMGEPLGEVFDALWQEVAWLHAKWGEYDELFGTKESRIALLNETASLFFRIVQDTLWEDTVLHIARLLDPPNTHNKENLSIERLMVLIDDANTKKTVSELVKAAQEAGCFSRDWRNRHIAHRDLKLAHKEGAKPLESASRKDVKDALTAIAAVLNAVTVHYMGSETHFDMPVHGGAAQLLYVLDDGLKADKERHERLTRGEMRKGDFDARDL